MNPLRLELHGFTAVLVAFKKDEVTLDLEVDSAIRTIALAGKNGSGKTTLLDNLQPWPVLPSRMRDKRFSMYDHIEEGEAKKVLVFEVRDTRYVATCHWKKTAKTKKAEGYLFVETDAGRKPYRLKDGTESDGKMTVFLACLEELLGPMDLFLRSAFHAQRAGTIAGMDRNVVKSMFGAMLGQEHLVELAEKARSVKTALSAVAVRSQADAAELRRRVDGLNEAAAALPSKRQSAKDIARKVTELRAQIESGRDALSKLEGAHAQLAQIAAQHDALEEQRKAHIEDFDAQIRAASGEAESQTEAIATAERKMLQRKDAYAARETELLNVIAGAQKALGDATMIEEASERVSLMIERNAMRARAIEELQTLEKKRRHYDLLIAQTTGELNRIESDGRNARANIEGCQARANQADCVPCSGMALQSKCQLMGGALKARQELPIMMDKRKQMVEAYKSLLAKVEALQAQKDVLVWVPAALRAAQEAHASMDREISATRTIAARVREVGTAQERLEGSTRELIRMREERGLFDEESARQIDALCRQAKKSRELLDQIQSRKDAALASIERQRASLPAKPDGQEIIKKRTVVAQMTSVLEASLREQDLLQRDIEDLERKLATSQALQQQLKESLERIERINAGVANYTLLAQALGPNGILALCIDEAGPDIAHLANELLSECFGDRFHLSIETQSLNANGGVSEDFRVDVLDAESGRTKALDVASGGEEVWLASALNRALVLYMAQQAGDRFACLFEDECDGALDEERRRQYVRMKGHMLDRIGYKREIYISQSPEAVAAADLVIRVEDLAAV